MTHPRHPFRSSCRRMLMAAAVAVTLSVLPAHAQDVPQTAPGGFETLAERLLPSVVNISTTTKVDFSAAQPQLPGMPQLPPGSPFEDFFREFYDQFNNQMPPVPGAENMSALGSGFIIDADNGYIVTNNHVIKDADEIRIILHDDTSLDATLVGVDEKTDLAVLKVTPVKPLKAVTFGDSDQARVGSWVLAIGNPFGLGGSVTAGIVSARQRDISAGPYDDFIQTDASINRGNSGGPMFNMKGEVIGVNTAIFSPSGGSVGIGFAVPSNLARNVVAQLIQYGETRRGWLGVRIQEVTPDIAESLGLGTARGALVSSLMEKSPAADAGIAAGDVIISFNNQKIDGMRKLPRIVAETEVGKKVPVTLWRKGREITVDVTLGQLEQAEQAASPDSRPAKPAAAAGKTTAVPQLGLDIALIDDAHRRNLGLAATAQGVVVVKIAAGSTAADSGLLPGDVIVEVDQTETPAPADVVRQVEAAEKAGKSAVLFFISRKDDRRFIALKLKK